MKRIEQQDEQALAVLYDRYARIIYSLCYRVLNNKTLAEEATQDTFMKVWHRAERWDANKGRLLSWMLTVARFAAIDRLRVEQRQSHPQNAPLDEVPAIPSTTGIPDDPQYHTGQHMRELLEKIPPEQSQLIQMAFFQGLTHRELSEKLNLPLGTVKTRVRLGLQKLKALWEETINSEVIDEG